MVEGNILQIIVFALFIGFALSTLEVEKKDFMMKIFNYCTEIFIKIMTAIMYVAPLGVFALMADACGTFGYAILVKILYLIVLYVAVLILVTYVMIGGSVALFSKKVGYVQFFKSMWKCQLLAFSTASCNFSISMGFSKKAVTPNSMAVWAYSKSEYPLMMIGI